MKFDDYVFDYLNGKEFSDGLKLKIAEQNKNVDRIKILEDISKGQKIIHLGCADHLNLIDIKIKNNTWLHSRLCHVSKRCLGIDINQEGIDFIKKLGFNDVICLDILEQDHESIFSDTWDYMIIGEILEHVNDPCIFLKNVNIRYKNYIKKLVITAPNAFSLQNVVKIFQNMEFVNSDHRYWFTPYTLAKIAMEAGLIPDEFLFCGFLPNDNSFVRNAIKNKLLELYPVLRPNILMVMELGS